VTRDRLMTELDLRYPAYGFAAHKGYSTRAHMRALATHGPCPEHRLSFANVSGPGPRATGPQQAGQPGYEADQPEWAAAGQPAR
jgi:ribonuclease HII